MPVHKVIPALMPLGVNAALSPLDVELFDGVDVEAATEVEDEAADDTIESLDDVGE
jgi:hypothetical protein